MNDVRTILAYIAGMTEDVAEGKGLTAKQWSSVKAKLARIEELLDAIPPMVYGGPVPQQVQAAGVITVNPAKPVLTVAGWIEAWKQAAMTKGGITRQEVDEMSDEIKGFYAEHKDPEVEAENYVRTVLA